MKLSVDSGTEHPPDFVTVLNLLLADECLLYSKARNFCTTVSATQQRPLYDLLQNQYDELSGIIDEVAEHIRELGGQAMGTMSEFLQHTRLDGQPAGQPPPARMIGHLIDDHEAIIRVLRGDLASCDGTSSGTQTGKLLAGLMGRHEKLAGALRAHLPNS